MKTRTCINMIFGLLFILVSACSKDEDKKTCGSVAYPSYNSYHAEYKSIFNGIATFELILPFENVCIYNMVEVMVNVWDKPNSQVYHCTAFAYLFTTAGLEIFMTDGISGWNGKAEMDLREANISNPGSFTVKVTLLIHATTYEEAMQKYTASVKGIDVSAILFRPKG